MTTTAAPSPSSGSATTKRAVLAWGLWDWGSAAYNSVVVTFVFTPYVVQGVVGDARPGGLTGTSWVGISTAVAGVFIALIAPITGQRADAGGHRRRNLAIWTALVIAVMFALFAVKADPAYLFLALILLALGTVFSEFAGVAYNAMLSQISTPTTIGRISGFGWALGYVGGIFLLLVAYFGFIAKSSWLGISASEGLPYRSVAVFSAVWFLIFAIPVFVAVPELPAGPAHRRTSFFGAYKLLLRDVRRLWETDRNAVRFLIAAAIYRDGLAAVFTFGAVLAVSVYGMAPSMVLIFGVAANLVAAVGALVMGRIEDVIGPKLVIMISLVGLLVAMAVLLFSTGENKLTMFWIFGLVLCLWVGPAQASSRAFLTRVAPDGQVGQMFGLYTTTGRAASFLAPALFALFTVLFSDRIGIVGIALVVAAGALLMLPVRSPSGRIPAP